MARGLLTRTLQLVTFSRRVEPLVCTPLPVLRSGYCAEESNVSAIAMMWSRAHVRGCGGTQVAVEWREGEEVLGSGRRAGTSG
jgi:hypothetical protein